MQITYAAIEIAWFIVHDELMPRDLSYDQAARKLRDENHYDLMIHCNEARVVMLYSQKNMDNAVIKLFEINKIAKNKYNDFQLGAKLRRNLLIKS